VTDYRDSSPYFDTDIIVRPVGIVGTGAAALAFKPWASLVPGKYTEEELRTLSEFYWAKKAEKPGNNQYCIDFRDLEHVYQLLDQLVELEGDLDNLPFDSTLPQLIRTLKFYIE
jgi:hypothetical protein